MQVDPEALLVPWLGSTLDVRVVTELPASLATNLPLVDVDHIGGADDIPTMAELEIDLGFYAASKGAASILARRGHQAVRYGLRGQVLTVGGMSATVFTARPSFLPRPDPGYDVDNVYRYLASYVIGFKTRPTASV